MTGAPGCALTVCRGCCCGTDDPPAANRRLERLQRELPDVAITVSDCLGPCSRRDVVVVRAAGHVPLWFGTTGNRASSDALIAWLRTGGPLSGPAPDALRGRAFRPDRRQPRRSARSRRGA